MFFSFFKFWALKFKIADRISVPWTEINLVARSIPAFWEISCNSVSDRGTVRAQSSSAKLDQSEKLNSRRIYAASFEYSISLLLSNFQSYLSNTVSSRHKICFASLAGWIEEGRELVEILLNPKFFSPSTTKFETLHSRCLWLYLTNAVPAFFRAEIVRLPEHFGKHLCHWLSS